MQLNCTGGGRRRRAEQGRGTGEGGEARWAVGEGSEEGALGGGRPPHGPHEVGELQHPRDLGAPLGLRRRALRLRLVPRPGHLVLRLLHRLGALLLELPLVLVEPGAGLLHLVALPAVDDDLLALEPVVDLGHLGDLPRGDLGLHLLLPDLPHGHPTVAVGVGGAGAWGGRAPGPARRRDGVAVRHDGQRVGLLVLGLPEPVGGGTVGDGCCGGDHGRELPAHGREGLAGRGVAPDGRVPAPAVRRRLARRRAQRVDVPELRLLVLPHRL
uniref:Uncharacterized protein n=1 Tax=Zea mays TaxID=4577 RepID=C4J1G0_MAIZE|nr:unknown [Zea mays]ACR35971.1 unknown [Zea mays]